MIDATDLLDLRKFLERLDRAAAGLLDERDRYGHKDLPGYLPWMGARYGLYGHEAPLSVFRGEGIALFLLARTLKPAVIAECYTGTGYAAACLAAGAPGARCLSADNYSEGDAGATGFETATALRDRLNLTNLELVMGSANDLDVQMNGTSAGLYFSDGPYGGAPRLEADVTVARHDTKDGQVDERRFVVVGGSHLSIMSSTIERRDALMAELGRYLPVVTP